MGGKKVLVVDALAFAEFNELYGPIRAGINLVNFEGMERCASLERQQRAE